jgi:hypothetical protein
MGRVDRLRGVAVLEPRCEVDDRVWPSRTRNVISRKTGSATITSTVREVDTPREIGWTGKTFGVRAVHIWRLEPRPDGTHVFTAESFEGPLARLLRRTMREVLAQALESGLDNLKVEAERRIQASASAAT